MAKKTEVRYINYYTSGSAARQVQPEPEKKPKVRLPRPPKRRQITLHVDLVAVGGIAVALVLLVAMVVGFTQLRAQQRQTEALRWYTEQLQLENQQLQEAYASGYDLEEIRQIAQAMGMVPIEEVPRQPIHVVQPVQTPEPTAWENFCAFLTGLFA